MKRKAFCCGTSLLVIALGSGCQMAGLIRENTEELKTTNQAVARNTTAVAATTQTMQELESALQRLKVSLDQVAQLDKPMSDVARLEEPLKAVGQLSRPVSALTRLSPVQLAASVILTILVFCGLLFLTIWAAVRLALRHRSA